MKNYLLVIFLLFYRFYNILFLDYFCTLWQNYPRQGTLYITENYIAFYSNIQVLNNQPNILQIQLKITDIISISKETFAMGVLDNSIKITTSSNQVIFKAF